MSAQTHLRQLGKDGPLVSALGTGLMGLSVFYGAVPSDEERFKFLDRAVEIGATFWDTAALYGDSEVLIGRWFKRSGKRNEVFLSSKFGIVMDPPMVFSYRSTGSYAKESCAKSLERLQTDYIDLFYLHHPNPETPIEETMRALAELKAEGKIKHIGLSNCSSSTIRRAVKIAPVAAVQIEYSPFVLEAENEASTNVLATCRELGIAVICYSPLGRGILTGAFSTKESLSDPKDGRAASLPWFSDGNREANAKIVEEFKQIADRHNCTTSQLSLAWLLKQGDNIIPNPGTKSIERLEENRAALDINLTDDHEKEIRAFLENAKIAGKSRPDKYKDAGWMDTKEEE
ncbi:hypothetical protein JX265_005677 [Neoarthrinium moseri]|uniref:NADP-dependent oxidoreductase domain-containing protein n=1 Tax=Neoarthrinium moseri TaxID=1658444 RepID=A0A9P9WMR0_9PEZI|nr:hypothetical protein JX266_005555 [Neoarthrinium moseri]KAI1871691.1 hypothetical protein JX265_005677 [Neoarthrinium moseri]